MTIAVEANGFSLPLTLSGDVIGRPRDKGQNAQNSFWAYLEKSAPAQPQPLNGVADPAIFDPGAGPGLAVSDITSVIAFRQLGLGRDVESFAAVGVLLSRELSGSTLSTDAAPAFGSLQRPPYSSNDATQRTLTVERASTPSSLSELSAQASTFLADQSVSSVGTYVGTMPLSGRSQISPHPTTPYAAGLTPIANRRLASQSLSPSTSQTSSAKDLSRATLRATKIRAEIVQELSRHSNSSVDVKIARGETGLVLRISLPSEETLPGKELERRLTRLVESMGDHIERIVYHSSHSSNSTDAPNLIVSALEERS